MPQDPDSTRVWLELLQSQKLRALGQLAAGVAHEVNTPAQYVTDNVTFLQRAFDKLWALLEAQAAVVDEARRGAVSEQALAQVDAMRAAARLDYLSRQMPRALQQSVEGLGAISSAVSAIREMSSPSGAEMQPSDLHEVIESAATAAKNEWQYVAELKLDFDWKLPQVALLRNELGQVFWHLLVNAAQAIQSALPSGSAEKGEIRVTTRTVADLVEVRVSDNGPGIEPEARQRVFEPFFSTRPNARAKGLGLAICHSVVVGKHGGTLGFETEQGRGTTFIVTLPIYGQAGPLASHR